MHTVAATTTDHSNSNGHVLPGGGSERETDERSDNDASSTANDIAAVEQHHEINNTHATLAAEIHRHASELENELAKLMCKVRVSFEQLAQEARQDPPPSPASAESASLTASHRSSANDAAAAAAAPKRGAVFCPPRKEFRVRNSLLTDLMQVSHFRTIYNMFCAILLLFSFTTFLSESVEHGGLKLDLSLLWWAFGKMPVALATWSCIQLASVVLLFVPLYTWASHRTAGSKRCDGFDYFMLAYYITYQTALIYFPLRVILDHDMPPATALFLSAEQIRMLMKNHAFVREKAVDVVIRSERGRREPDFGRFLYFLFAPTLVYRDTYPRTTSTDWRLVAVHIWHLAMCIAYLYYVLVRFAMPAFRDFKPENLTQHGLVLASFHAMFPGVMIMFIVFFGLLHSWMNAFAEALRFGDRQFYRDWWNSASFAQFYRTWNVVVHDWLHQYVYRDLVLLLTWWKGDSAGWWWRNVALVSVFVISAVWHEYFVMIVMHCAFPILFGKFVGIGMLLYFVAPLLDRKLGRSDDDDNAPSSSSNSRSPTTGQQQTTAQGIFFWLGMFMGYGWLLSLYSTEWYARINCASGYTGDEAWKDFFVPRTIACNQRMKFLPVA